jgi:hypothetical protein
MFEAKRWPPRYRADVTTSLLGRCGFKVGWFVAASSIGELSMPVAMLLRSRDQHGGSPQTSHMIVPKKMGRVSLDEERAICAAISRACRSPARRAELADD